MTQRPRAEATVRALLRAGLLDPTRKIRAGDEVVIPVRADAALPEWAARLDARLVDAPDLAAREGRRSPREQVVDLLRDALPAPLLDAVPDKWEQHSDVLVLRLPPELDPHAQEVAAAFAAAFDLKSVLHDSEGVSGELREMSARLLFGTDPVAFHVENGVRYRFDASRVMFSSGNVAERMRVAKLPAKGETVVDMFAGIGYFALPLALHAGAARVHALEKNPVSYRYLVENARENGVAERVLAWNGDNREYPESAFADRVMMGYFPGTAAFLPTAFAFLKAEGGVIHYHDTSHAESWKREMTDAVLAAARACGSVVAIESARIVKTHSPGVVHAVLDVRVRRG